MGGVGGRMVLRAPILPCKPPPVSTLGLRRAADPKALGVGLPTQGTREEPHLSSSNLSDFFCRKVTENTMTVESYLALKGLNHIVNCDPNAD